MSSFTPKTIPLEILQAIFEHLRPQDKVKLAAVNREWHTYADSNDWVWYKLDFGRFSRRPGFDYFDINSVAHPLISKINNNTRQLYLQHSFILCNWEKLGLHRCHHLRELVFDYIGRSTGFTSALACDLPGLKKLFLAGHFDITIPMRFLQNCSNLEQACFVTGKEEEDRLLPLQVKSARLKSLKFEFELKDNRAYFPEMTFPESCALEELEILGCHKAVTHHFEHLVNLKRLCIPVRLELEHLWVPLTLQELFIPLDAMGDAAIVSPMPNLRALGLSYWSHEDMDGTLIALTNVLESIGVKLEELRLTDMGVSGFVEPRGTVIRYIERTGKAKNIKIFATESDGRIRKSVLDAATRAFPKLQELYLLGPSSVITENDLRASLEKLPDLKHLESWFYGRYSPDMLEWLQRKGINTKPDRKKIRSKSQLMF